MVWNEHPTEVVAGFHCRAVAKLLRGMGHEVIVEKIPAKETIYGMARSGTPQEAYEKLLANQENINRIPNKVAAKHKAAVFNFHSSPPLAMGKSEKLDPKEFRVSEIDYTDLNGLTKIKDEIQFIKSGKQHYIEVPGILETLPEKTRAKHEAKIQAIRNLRQLQWSIFAGIKPSLADHYQTQRTPLHVSEQQKYLHPAISEKIAAAIHKRISRK